MKIDNINNKIRDLFKVKLYAIRSGTKKKEIEKREREKKEREKQREKKEREREREREKREKKRERDFKYLLTLILTGGHK